MDQQNEDWSPPSARRDEVEGLPEEAVRAKWALYSKTYQGIACLVLIYFANKYCNSVLGQTEAAIIADALFAFGGGLAVWWIKEGRRTANAILYWLPRTREKKIAVATGVPVDRLLRT